MFETEIETKLFIDFTQVTKQSFFSKFNGNIFYYNEIAFIEVKFGGLALALFFKNQKII